MRQFLSFIIKETRHILRDKRTMLILFGMPIVLMLLFGFAITNDVKNVRTLIIAPTISNQSTRVAIDRISTSEYFDIVGITNTPSEAERAIRDQKADLAIVLKTSKGNTSVQFIVDGSDPNMAQQWTAYAQQTLTAGLTGTNVVNSKLLYNPQMKSAYNFVPAIMGMLLLLICAMMTSVSIVKEKENGTMEVLLVSPVRPLMIILAKAIPYLVLALLILTSILLMARFILDVPLAGSIGYIILVSLIYILLSLSLGLLISNIARTQFVALLVSAMVLLLPTVMLSGMLFPVESMPEILQWISAIIPPRYYIQAMRKLMIMGVGLNEVITEITVLSGMTIFLLSVSIAKFKTRLE